MVDLYLSLGVMLSLCGLATIAGAMLQDRARSATVVCVEVLVCLVACVYMRWIWDRPILSEMIPFSGTIILGNWLPVFGSFLGGICSKTESIAQLRRTGLAAVLFAISAYSLTKPILGSPPECVPIESERTLGFQTTDQTCSPACAASLLRLHGIPASESELASLCLTRRGTHWLGVYRGLKLKTAGTAWDVVVEEVDSRELFSGKLRPGILAMSFHAGDSGQQCDPESGFRSSVGHSVLILSTLAPASLEVFDPEPAYGLETWSESLMLNVRQGILLRLVPRDAAQPAAKVNLAALRRDLNTDPQVVRR